MLITIIVYYEYMNKEQCSGIMRTTCYILDSNAEVETTLKEYGIDKKDLAKITKALDLINEVNHKYSQIQKRLKN